MAALLEIVAFANRYLNIDQFDDYCPNGLQVDGRAEVKKILTGVTASQALLDGAVERGVDMILVHHGYFWKGEPQAITGLKYKKIRTLMESNISLLGYHLPLDAHPVCGNNVMLAKELDVRVETAVGPGRNPLIVIGDFLEPVCLAELEGKIHRKLSRMPLCIGADKNKVLRRVAICTGGAQNYFSIAIEHGVDVFITGEVSEQQYHLAMESGVGFISAGHHATERYGVRAFGEVLCKEFSVEVEYLEIPNPV